MPVPGSPPSQPTTLVDDGNPFLGPDYPATLTTGKVLGLAGERLCLTIRSGGATLSVVLNRADAHNWAAQIEQGAGSLSSLVIPNGVLKPPPGSPS